MKVTGALLAAATVLGMTCLWLTVRGPPRGGQPSGSASSPSSSGRQPVQAIFPLSVSRTGGIAGFPDTLRIEADGAVTVTSRGQGPHVVHAD